MGKGYKYLYLAEKDANRFTPGTDFHGMWAEEGGERRYVLEVIRPIDGFMYRYAIDRSMYRYVCYICREGGRGSVYTADFHGMWAEKGGERRYVLEVSRALTHIYHI